MKRYAGADSVQIDNTSRTTVVFPNYLARLFDLYCLLHSVSKSTVVQGALEDIRLSDPKTLEALETTTFRDIKSSLVAAGKYNPKKK